MTSRFSPALRIRVRKELFLCKPFAGLAAAAGLLLPVNGWTQTLNTRINQLGSEPSYSHNQTGSGPTLSDSYQGPLSYKGTSVSFGSANLVFNGSLPAGSQSVIYSLCSGGWSDTVTINPTNPALNGTPATLRITYHATGSISASGYCGWAYYDITMDGSGTVNYDSMGNTFGNCGGSTRPLSDFNTFTYDRAIQLGSPLQFSVSHNCFFRITAGADGGQGVADLLLTSGAMTVLDGQGNPISYSSTAGAGSASATTVLGGTSYTGFTLSNDTNNAHLGSTVRLLGGTASTNTSVTATFTGAPPTNEVALASDVVDVSGTSNDLVVVQLSYDPALAQSLFGSENGLRLVWLNPATGKWLNAILGNVGGTLQFFPRAYNPATDLHLGYCGLDTTNHVVWAVLNHNSTFAVGQPPLPLQLNSVKSGTNGAVSFTVTGTTNSQYVVEYSANLTVTNWSFLGNVTLDSNGVGTFTDSASIVTNRERFYRARQ